MLQMNFILIPYFDWLLGPLKGQIFRKKKIFKNLFLRNCYVPGISLYKEIVVFFFVPVR